MKTDQKASTPESTQAFLASMGMMLKNLRLAKELTFEEVVRTCGFSRQTVWRIEKGDPAVSIGQVARYAELLGLISDVPEPATSEAAAVRGARPRKQAAQTSNAP